MRIWGQRNWDAFDEPFACLTSVESASLAPNSGRSCQLTCNLRRRDGDELRVTHFNAWYCGYRWHTVRPSGISQLPYLVFSIYRYNWYRYFPYLIELYLIYKIIFKIDYTEKEEFLNELCLISSYTIWRKYRIVSREFPTFSKFSVRFILNAM